MAVITAEQSKSNHPDDENKEEENKYCIILEEEITPSNKEQVNIIRIRQVIEELDEEMKVT